MINNSFSNRKDLLVIESIITENSRVLDLGCGDGAFLRHLIDTKNISAIGLEGSQELITKSIANGVSVIQRNLNYPLDFAEDNSFDYVILSHTLQELEHPEVMLKEIVRVGKKAIISYINFGFYENRLQLLFTGKMPTNKFIPHMWYNTPNIHLGTISDFKVLCKELDVKILKTIPIGKSWSVPANLWKNMLAPSCVFILA